MACTHTPDPWFLEELGVIFHNPFTLEWDCEQSQFHLWEYATHRHSGTKHKYYVMSIYPYEQHRGTIALLEMSNVRNEVEFEEREHRAFMREYERLRRSRRLSAELAEPLQEAVSALNIPNVSGCKGSAERQWLKGYLHNLENQYDVDLGKEIWTQPAVTGG